jgi:FemAB family protein
LESPAGLSRDIGALTAQAGLHVRFRSSTPEDWDRVLNRLAYAPVAYSGAMLDYYLAYAQGQERDASDVSIILLNDGRECGLWPLSLTATKTIGSNGGVLLPPLFVADLPANTCKRITQQCLDFLDLYLESHNLSGWKSSEPFSGGVGLTEWHDRSMKRGCTVTLRHELFVDLSLDPGVIKSSLRKSYRPLISAGQRLWNVATLTQINESIWTKFRELHAHAAGRVTRSAASWELQHKAIGAGSAFLVYLQDAAERMVGAGLFHVTRDESIYGVGAYDRDLFDKPLGHVVQFRAIQELQSRRIRWHKLGARGYPSEQPPPTPKELTISDFKQGFATHLFPRYEIEFRLR